MFFNVSRPYLPLGFQYQRPTGQRPSQICTDFSMQHFISLDGHGATDVCLGWGHGLAVSDKGVLYSWGWGGQGQLGQGDYNSQYIPRPVSFFEREKIIICSVSAGADCSVAVSEDGQVFIWGRNEFWDGMKLEFQEDGATRGECVPILLEGIPNKYKIVSVSVGLGHFVALTESGEVFAWGLNSYGQLGLGNLENKYKPEKVHFEHRVVQAVCGRVNTAFVTDNGQLWTCGSGKHGRLGIGDTDNYSEPVLVDMSDIGDYVEQVACGYDCVVASIK
eukprot:TRINITY_DN24275_c0_g1_i1.p1 TRINITY_DN24275_c0_g1~~TRINITY_DN24275_c0_g1_i1.p1  ORF type:complete len:276 (-),score=32.33 TRINITY_DN24275_c0_g1_i1:1-828(-)